MKQCNRDNSERADGQSYRSPIGSLRDPLPMDTLP